MVTPLFFKLEWRKALSIENSSTPLFEIHEQYAVWIEDGLPQFSLKWTDKLLFGLSMATAHSLKRIGNLLFRLNIATPAPFLSVS